MDQHDVVLGRRSDVVEDPAVRVDEVAVVEVFGDAERHDVREA